MQKLSNATVLGLIVVLSACTLTPDKEEVMVYQEVDCNVDDKCTIPKVELITNGGLAESFATTYIALNKCKIQLESLQSCVKKNNEIFRKHNESVK